MSAQMEHSPSLFLLNIANKIWDIFKISAKYTAKITHV